MVYFKYLHPSNYLICGMFYDGPGLEQDLNSIKLACQILDKQ